ncbi:MAG TPA: lipopolysaccharide biosynthesis protein, partial [Thermoanaerobaculia bacterium]|nr:lipopolysaccharide biosynthesis protein [Thermoanaerobaculia bacterium]
PPRPLPSWRMTVFPEKQSATTPQGARATARGTVELFAAQVFMAAAGLAIHVVLTRLLAPQAYGTLAVITSVIVWWELLGLQLFARATTRFVAAAGERWRDVAGTALLGTASWCGALAALSVVLAPAISRLLGDPSLTPYLRWFSADIVLYGLLQVVRSVLVGRHRYRAFALTYALYWGAKAVAVSTLVAAGLDIAGAIAGSVVASLVALVVSARAGGAAFGRGFPLRRLVGFALPLLGAGLVFQTVNYLDLWALKALGAEPVAIGRYGLAKNVSAVLMGFLAVVGTAALPSLTRALVAGQRETIVELVQQSFRFVLLMGVGGVAALAAGSEALLAALFSPTYARAAVPLAMLTAAAVCFAASTVATAILTAAGSSRLCLMAALPALPLAALLAAWLVPRWGPIGAAGAALGGAAGLVVPLGAAVHRQLGVLAPWRSLARIAAAATTVFLLGRALPLEGIAGILEPFLAYATYLLLLIALGELGRRDLEVLPLWPLLTKTKRGSGPAER